MSPITWFFVILTLVLVPVGIIAAIWKEMKRSPEEAETNKEE
jgi:hypothetical protein